MTKSSQNQNDAKCPVCGFVSKTKVQTSPYWGCHGCGLWFQHPHPPKVYESVDEKDEHGGYTGHLMSDHDKKVNDDLAGWLFETCLQSKPGRTLDIGSKYPYLAHCLKNRGCEAVGMDNIDIVPEYSKALDVPMLMNDFEKVSAEFLIKGGKFDLITMVHVFEHMYEPAKALKKLRKMVTENGRVYLRLPQSDVPGYERDMDPGHYSIHPYFHSLGSILELVASLKNVFVIEHYQPMVGSGQADYVLKPITQAPKIFAGFIVKNEERDLPICIQSLKGVVEGLVIVDTGSIDKTKEVAIASAKAIGVSLDYSTYLEASEKDETGDWKLWNFSKARNQFVQKIDETAADYCLWMDADDELRTPRAITRASYLNGYDVFGLKIDAGGGKWTHHRLWKTRHGVKFDGAIHEYPVLDHCKGMDLNDSLIWHNAAPTIGEGSNARNLRILEREWEEKKTTRIAFYMANTHNDGGRTDDAIKWYTKRIDMGEGFKDEMMFAYLYRARAFRTLRKNDLARQSLLEGVSKDPQWSELWTDLSYISYDESKWHQAMGEALVALSQPNKPTQLWREPNKYTDQPCRMISWCHEQLGDRGSALKWAIDTMKFLPDGDKDWEDRINRLQKKRIAFIRPGAIGDVIMTLRLIPEWKKNNPEFEVNYFTSPSIGNQLQWLMTEVGVDICHDVAQFGSMVNQFDHVVNLVGYPIASEGYPAHAMKRHLLQYFGAEMGLNETQSMKDTMVPRPELDASWQLPDAYATIHVKAGWSPYKEWPVERWEEVVRHTGIPFVQIGASTDPKIPGAIHDFMGRSLQDAITLIANAKLHVGIDSFSNHVTGYTWLNKDGSRSKTPAIILWGSTQWSAAGYDGVNLSANNWCDDLKCQPCFKEDPKISAMPNGECIKPIQWLGRIIPKCMNEIRVEDVVIAVNSEWSKL